MNLILIKTRLTDNKSIREDSTLYPNDQHEFDEWSISHITTHNA